MGKIQSNPIQTNSLLYNTPIVLHFSFHVFSQFG